MCRQILKLSFVLAIKQKRLPRFPEEGAHVVFSLSGYTIRLSSSDIYPGGSNGCCYGVSFYHYFSVSQIKRLIF